MCLVDTERIFAKIVLMRWTVTVALALTLVASSAVAAQEHLTVGLQDDSEGASVLGAFADSLKLLMIEHGIRVGFQEKTRRELGGNFWGDYRRSVRMPGQWGDTDGWAVNYIGHPTHGAAAGYIWLDHEPGAPKTITLDSRYWASRGRATAWSAGYRREPVSTIPRSPPRTAAVAATYKERSRSNHLRLRRPRRLPPFPHSSVDGPHVLHARRTMSGCPARKSYRLRRRPVVPLRVLRRDLLCPPVRS
jgi:hypothetical protein